MDSVKYTCIGFLIFFLISFFTKSILFNSVQGIDISYSNCAILKRFEF